MFAQLREIVGTSVEEIFRTWREKQLKYFFRCADVAGSGAWLISSNSYDVIGVISAGMKAGQVRRSAEMILDPWELEPIIIVNSLSDLVMQTFE